MTEVPPPETPCESRGCGNQGERVLDPYLLEMEDQEEWVHLCPRCYELVCEEL